MCIFFPIKKKKSLNVVVNLVVNSLNEPFFFFFIIKKEKKSRAFIQHINFLVIVSFQCKTDLTNMK